jgi:outer membrane lipase/esterase
MRALVRRWMFVAALPIVAALAACSDSRFAEPFAADRVVAFGDEASLVLADGRKYSVNDFTDGNLDCAKNRIWLQDLAANFGKPLSTCAGTSSTASSVSRAQAGAKADGLRQQVDAHLASDRLGEKDLVTMYVGLNDIVGEYARLAADGESAITARLGDAGRLLGAQVNRVATAGSPVLVFAIHDLGLTPFGAAEEAASPGRAGLLTRLTSAFNTAMRLEIINDGRMIGLVDSFDLLRAMGRPINAQGITNASQPACLDTAALPDCSTQTLIQNSEGGSINPVPYLWADKLRFGSTAHNWLGQIAIARARNNPF